MNKLLICLILGSFTLLGAITVTDTKGFTQSHDYSDLASLPREEFTTVREKEGETRIDTWQGIRFDLWLKANLDKPFKVIRLESADRYMVSFSQAEFDTLASWLVFAQNGKTLPEDQLRVIFPSLRDMKWVRGLDRVVLEDFDPLGMPSRFEFMDARLESAALVVNPEPFINLRGYFFADLLPLSSRQDSLPAILYSADGMKLALEYPRHLEGAILELTDEGFNLKSPVIPGGMWLKNIVYIQLGDFALIHPGNLEALIALNRVLDWKLGPDVHFVVHKEGGDQRITLNDVLASPELLDGALSFELVP
ncbi:MAG: hypothetical protein KBA54_05415 [Candidatus Cloacimonetes bacterium]|nr:hypothetical protein [Candidatus Cloacimonadota bacterium]